METRTINNHQVLTYRKNMPKIVERMRDKGIEMLDSGHSIEKIATELGSMLKASKSNRIYTSYQVLTEWNERESFSIRNSSEDCTYVTFKPANS